MYVSKYKYIYIYTSFELLFCYYIYTSLEAPTWRIKNQVTIRSSCMIRPSRRRSSRPFSKKLCQLPSWASSGAERQGFRFSCTGDTQMMKNHFKFSGYIYIYIFFALFFPVTAWSTKNQPHQQVGTSLFRIPKNIPSDPDPIHPSKAAKSNFLGFVLVDRSCTWKIQWLNVNVSPN